MLNKEIVNYILPECVDTTLFYLIVEDLKVGVVFSQKLRQSRTDSEVIIFEWKEVLNKTAIEELSLLNTDAFRVEIAPIGTHGKIYRLGNIEKKIMMQWVSPDFTNGTNVLIETSKRRKNGDLPNVSTVIQSDVTLVAFYLPQYHPIVENDIWWGDGFTEWTKVSSAKPRFKGHKQPKLPGELGFYDLRLPQNIKKQAALAREHGIGAFCFYHYWFGGKRLLEKPLELFLENHDIDMPFCICWANEPWSRRWDGQEEDVLMDQPHTPESDARFILDVIPVLKDPRYLRVKGKPLLLVYRATLLSLPEQTTDVWRQICRDHGVGEIELSAVESFGFESPDEYGFDSTVEFPPHGFEGEELSVKSIKAKKPFEGKAWRYSDAVAYYSAQPPRPWKRYRGVMPGWDNTPRRGAKGYAFVKSTPQVYAQWLSHAIEDTRNRLETGERLVFINAWNEWGEGAVLEPDMKSGRAYLEATVETLQGRSNLDKRFDKWVSENQDVILSNSILAEIKERFDTYDRTLNYMKKMLETSYTPKELHSKPIAVSDLWPEELQQKEKKVYKASGSLDLFCIVGKKEFSPLIPRYKPLNVHGWMIIAGQIADVHQPIYLMMVEKTVKKPFFAPISKRIQRPDLVSALNLSKTEDAQFAGFDGIIECSKMPRGQYGISLVQKIQDGWGLITLPNEFELV
jgi:hypothetical protein